MRLSTATVSDAPGLSDIENRVRLLTTGWLMGGTVQRTKDPYDTEKTKPAP